MSESAAPVALREEPARFSYDQFIEIAALPPLADLPGKVELVDGVIVRMSPALSLHAKYTSQLTLKLGLVFDGRHNEQWAVLTGLTMKLSDSTVREPDIVVARDFGDQNLVGSPDVTLLVVEISHATLQRDLGPKRADYAQAGIPHYWIADVEGRKLIALSQPENGDYRKSEETAFGSPVNVPGTDEWLTLV